MRWRQKINIFPACKRGISEGARSSADRYRFNGEPLRFLHDHRRRVPTQDVDCSIVVGMGAQAALATAERRLAFAAFPVHGCAGRTGLRGVAGIDLAQVSAPFFAFLGDIKRQVADPAD
ncbi:hypothetical protein IE4872_PD00626 (plasmid) [Rhizobium gallicum]|uniref:Uncharacterized protein n=1 Tax=Rhizobium gallicum TaxID=56730 RepID=A0A1L5NTD1_9HYPH|nr:hypothetical protein IE4872_PD00626 [Rhizobium gallicum]